MTVDHSQSKLAGSVFNREILVTFASILMAICLVWFLNREQRPTRHSVSPILDPKFPELAIADGDPHIRALMLTISASESNHKYADALLYGGRHIHDFSQHPDLAWRSILAPIKGTARLPPDAINF